MNLNEYLEEYKSATLALIDAIRKDEEVEYLINKRENILESLNNLNFDKEEVKAVGNSLQLLELEDELKNLVKREQVKIKKQIDVLKKAKKVNTNYNRIENRARVLNKSI